MSSPHNAGLEQRPRLGGDARLVATALPPNAVRVPIQSVNTPPASSMMGCSAAASHGDMVPSHHDLRAARSRRADSRSSRPSVRLTPRVARERAPAGALLRAFAGKRSSVVSTVASRKVATSGHAAAARRSTSIRRPAPRRHLIYRREIRRARQHVSPSHSATSVPQSGTPRTKVLVPSIGSMTHRRARAGPLLAELLAENAILRETCRRPSSRAPAPPARSATVTGDPSAFVSTEVTSDSAASATSPVRRATSAAPASSRVRDRRRRCTLMPPAPECPHSASIALDGAHGRRPIVKDSRDQRRIRARTRRTSHTCSPIPRRPMPRRARRTAVATARVSCEIVAASRAVAIDAREQDLAGAATRRTRAPTRPRRAPSRRGRPSRTRATRRHRASRRCSPRRTARRSARRTRSSTSGRATAARVDAHLVRARAQCPRRRRPPCARRRRS